MLRFLGHLILYPAVPAYAPAPIYGAAGVRGQGFTDIEAYGVQRWLGELALALRQEIYRPGPIRRVFIPKAKGKLRPPAHLDRAGSGLHDSSDAGAGTDL